MRSFWVSGLMSKLVTSSVDIPRSKSPFPSTKALKNHLGHICCDCSYQEICSVWGNVGAYIYMDTCSMRSEMCSGMWNFILNTVVWNSFCQETISFYISACFAMYLFWNHSVQSELEVTARCHVADSAEYAVWYISPPFLSCTSIPSYPNVYTELKMSQMPVMQHSKEHLSRFLMRISDVTLEVLQVRCW